MKDTNMLRITSVWGSEVIINYRDISFIEDISDEESSFSRIHLRSHSFYIDTHLAVADIWRLL